MKSTTLADMQKELESLKEMRDQLDKQIEAFATTIAFMQHKNNHKAVKVEIVEEPSSTNNPFRKGSIRHDIYLQVSKKSPITTNELQQILGKKHELAVATVPQAAGKIVEMGLMKRIAKGVYTLA